MSPEKHFVEGYRELDKDWYFFQEIIKKKKAESIKVSEHFKKALENCVSLGMVEVLKTTAP